MPRGIKSAPAPAAPTFLDRLSLEKSDLADKIEKLKRFMFTEQFTQLPAQEMLLLKHQLYLMENYYYILLHRITLYTD